MTDTIEAMIVLERDLADYGRTLGNAIAQSGERAKLLLRLGNRQLSMKEVVLTGCYVALNVSYNIDKLVAAGLVNAVGAFGDKRVTLISATPAGREAQSKLAAAHEAFIKADLARARRLGLEKGEQR